jgi:hypothetical protein
MSLSTNAIIELKWGEPIHETVSISTAELSVALSGALILTGALRLKIAILA